MGEYPKYSGPESEKSEPVDRRKFLKGLVITGALIASGLDGKASAQERPRRVNPERTDLPDISESNREEWEREIVEGLGEGALRDIRGLKSVRNSAERAEQLKQPKDLIIEGLENCKLYGGKPITPELLKSLLATLPADITVNINKIEFINDYEFAPQEEGLPRNTLRAARMNRKDRTITFTAGILNDPDKFPEVLTHEASHLSDWRSNQSLTYTERLYLCAQTLKRIPKGTRRPIPYVEALDNPNNDKRAGKLANEYYAETRKDFLFVKDTDLPAEDKELMSQLQELASPKFDRIKAAGERQKIWASYTKG